LHDALSFLAADVPFQIKWPNDIMVAGAKLSGILLERSGDAVVIGMGVNLAFHPEGLDRKVTSLRALGAVVPEAADFQIILADRFDGWLARWRTEGLPALREAWVARAHPKGTALRVNAPDGSATDGLFDGLAEDGALMLRLADGAIRAIHAGDIFLI
jgi:BirA family biotin operon repressor/biotin-[acetyl-CoA-carboxylase] ligase